MKDITIGDTITIPKEWVPVIQQVLGFVTEDLEVDPDYTPEQKQLITEVSIISAGLNMRMRNAPLVALPRVVVHENEDGFYVDKEGDE